MLLTTKVAKGDEPRGWVGSEQEGGEEGGMEVMVQRRRIVAEAGCLAVSEAGWGLEGGDGGLLLLLLLWREKELERWGQGRRW